MTCTLLTMGTALKSKVSSVLPAGNRALARCRSMRRRPRSAVSCSASAARKRAAGQPSLSARAARAAHIKLDVPMKHVAYRGAAPLSNDLAGGHVTVGMSGLPPLVPLVEAGTVRLIATSSAARSKLTSDAESFGEAGI